MGEGKEGDRHLLYLLVEDAVKKRCVLLGGKAGSFFILLVLFDFLCSSSLVKQSNKSNQQLLYLLAEDAVKKG